MEHGRIAGAGEYVFKNKGFSLKDILSFIKDKVSFDLFWLE